MTISVIQMNSQDGRAANPRAAETLVSEAVEGDRPDLVALRERFACQDEIRARLPVCRRYLRG